MNQTIENIVANIESIELRNLIFLPVQDITENSTILKEHEKNKYIRSITTNWGQVDIRGFTLLTQIHRNLLNNIYRHCRQMEQLENGEITISFTQEEILHGYKSGKSNHEIDAEWLLNKIEEIRNVIICLKNTKGELDFNIISCIEYSGPLSSYFITIDKTYLKLCEQETLLGQIDDEKRDILENKIVIT